MNPLLNTSRIITVKLYQVQCSNECKVGCYLYSQNPLFSMIFKFLYTVSLILVIMRTAYTGVLYNDRRVTLVYTKSISRFARNTVDVLTIVRELKKVNAPVYFEIEQLYSFDKEAELAISLHGAIAGYSVGGIKKYTWKKE